MHSLRAWLDKPLDSQTDTTDEQSLPETSPSGTLAKVMTSMLMTRIVKFSRIWISDGWWSEHEASGVIYKKDQRNPRERHQWVKIISKHKGAPQVQRSSARSDWVIFRDVAEHDVSNITNMTSVFIRFQISLMPVDNPYLENDVCSCRNEYIILLSNFKTSHTRR